MAYKASPTAFIKAELPMLVIRLLKRNPMISHHCIHISLVYVQYVWVYESFGSSKCKYIFMYQDFKMSHSSYSALTAVLTGENSEVWKLETNSESERVYFFPSIWRHLHLHVTINGLTMGKIKFIVANIVDGKISFLSLIFKIFQEFKIGAQLV